MQKAIVKRGSGITCPACEYTCDYEKAVVIEEVRFRSGPRKGELKGYEKKIVISGNSNEFHDVSLTGCSSPVIEKCGETSEIHLSMCPECGTLFGDAIDNYYDDDEDYWYITRYDIDLSVNPPVLKRK